MAVETVTHTSFSTLRLEPRPSYRQWLIELTPLLNQFKSWNDPYSLLLFEWCANEIGLGLHDGARIDENYLTEAEKRFAYFKQLIQGCEDFILENEQWTWHKQVWQDYRDTFKSLYPDHPVLSPFDQKPIDCEPSPHLFAQALYSHMASAPFYIDALAPLGSAWFEVASKPHSTPVEQQEKLRTYLKLAQKALRLYTANRHAELIQWMTVGMLESERKLDALIRAEENRASLEMMDFQEHTEQRIVTMQRMFGESLEELRKTHTDSEERNALYFAQLGGRLERIEALQAEQRKESAVSEKRLREQIDLSASTQRVALQTLVATHDSTTRAQESHIEAEKKHITQLQEMTEEDRAKIAQMQKEQEALAVKYANALAEQRVLRSKVSELEDELNSQFCTIA